MHPKEKVNELIKYRDELRRIARESNLIDAEQHELDSLANNISIA